MEDKCSRSDECSHPEKCKDGCGFKHFDKIVPLNNAIKFLGDEFFKKCNETGKSQGGRFALDECFIKLFEQRFPELRWLGKSERKIKFPVGAEEVDLNIKCDGAFTYTGKDGRDRCIIYEIKGAGANTNDILSTICAAQLLKISKSKRFPHYRYYYIGETLEKKGIVGLKREYLLDQARASIFPYVKWAEEQKYLKFYGVVDIEDLLEEIRIYLHSEL